MERMGAIGLSGADRTSNAALEPMSHFVKAKLGT